MQRQIPIELYVNAAKGDDTASGTSLAPYKTLTHALQTAKPNSIIYLSRGNYTAENGEQFPLVVPNSLAIVGNVAAKGSGVLLQGNGNYESASFGQQSVTVVLQGDAEFRGVTVTNSAAKGTGIWIESATPTVSNCTLTTCSREGILVTGTANPFIDNCLFRENAASGLTLVRNARGELRSNVYRQNGFGIAISDWAAPLLVSNQIFENRCGIALSGRASPILRGNVLTQNTEDGLAVFGQAAPDLGTQSDPAGNRLRQNQRFDLHNATTQPLISSGNQLNPNKVNGSIEFLATRSPHIYLSAPATPTTPAPVAAYVSPVHAPVDLADHEAAALIQPLLDRQILSLTSDAQFDPQGQLSATEFAGWMQNAGLHWTGLDWTGLRWNVTRPLTRLQVITALVKAAGLTGGHPKLLSRYLDRAQIPSAQSLTVATALQHGLIGGLIGGSSSQNRLNLLHPTTRVEAGVMLHQTLVTKGQAVAITPLTSVEPTNTQRTVSQSSQSSRRPPVVVLDPGHGGSDPGMVTQVKPEADEMQVPADGWAMDRSAAGVSMSPLPAGMMEMSAEMPTEMSFGMGMQPESAPMPRMPDDPPAMPSLQEKEVVLSIAQAVASFLKQQGIQVVLTRVDDRNLTPTERVEIAKHHQADAFVSIHANASRTNQSTINGIETYYNPDSLAGSQLSWAIHKALTRMPDMEDRGVHAATFYTLRSHLIAATHVEVGYITGSKDAPSLGNSAYHRYLARSIANGILRYVQQKEN